MKIGDENFGTLKFANIGMWGCAGGVRDSSRVHYVQLHANTFRKIMNTSLLSTAMG